MYMSRLRTKKQINYILGKVGADGLMGQVVPAKSRARALEIIAGVPEAMSQRFASELSRQDLVIFSQEADGMRLQLSVKGIHRLQQSQITNLTIATPKQWDGLWRMVVFDIPASHKHARYFFTAQLRRLGFVMVRDSTWFHPYPCQPIIEELTRHCAITRHVTFAEVSRLDTATSNRLKRVFTT